MQLATHPLLTDAHCTLGTGAHGSGFNPLAGTLATRRKKERKDSTQIYERNISKP